MSLIIGIDPGCSGALVAIDEQGAYIAHLNMPVIKIGGSNRVNGAAVAARLNTLGSLPFSGGPIIHAYLEQVHSMPGQGVSSVFNFGHAAGVVEGILQGMNIPYTLVTPQAWKKSAGLIGSDKDAARSRAIQLYPALRALDAKAKGQAIADALLIARHGLGVKA
jgi:crossover junction endodeoxyribonuclease RuvC